MVSIPVDTSAISDGEIITAESVLLPLDNLKSAVDDTLNGVQPFDQLNLGSSSEVTINSGTITVTKTHHRIDTEANAALDVLDSILGGTEGDILKLRLENSARKVIVKHGTGNIRLNNGDFRFNSSDETLTLFHNGLFWTQVGGWRGILIPRTVLPSDINTISITNIPPIFTHLKLYFEIRTTQNTSIDYLPMMLNADGNANYSSILRLIQHPGTTFTYSVMQDNQFMLRCIGNFAQSDQFASGEVIIFNYADPTRPRQIHANGYASTGLSEQWVWYQGGCWMNTTQPVTQIDLTTTGLGVSIAAGSAYMLMGIA